MLLVFEAKKCLFALATMLNVTDGGEAVKSLIIIY